MPSRPSSSKRALDDSHLVLRRRPVERSGSCLRFTPSIDHIAARNISSRTHNSLPTIGDDHFQTPPGYYPPPIRGPNENPLRVTSETRSHGTSVAKPEPFGASMSRVDAASLLRKASGKKQTGVNTFSKQAGQNKITDHVQTGGFMGNTRKSDGGLLLKTSDTKKSGTADGFSFGSTLSSRKEGSKELVGRSLDGNTLLTSGLEKKYSHNDAGQEVQLLKRHHSGMESREVSSQQWSKHSISAWPSLQNGPYEQISLHVNDAKHFEGGKSNTLEFHSSELQGSLGGNGASKISASPTLERGPELGGHPRPNFLTGLERIASSLLSTREQFFVEGSFNIKFRSWITFVFLTVLIVSCSTMVLKILFLKMEITRLHASLRRCTSEEFDKVIRDGTDEQLQNISGLALGKHLSRTALVMVTLAPFFWRKKTVQLWELSRKFIAGTEEDAPIGKRVAYGVDILFSTRSYMKPTALLLATLLLICGGGIALFAVSEDSLADAMWRSWTYVADSGNHADSEGTLPRIVSVLISFGGMLIFALMLGLISDAISEKVDSLRKGKSEVLESGHTLILGWSDKLGSLLKQLSIANQSLGGGVVVVLAERDKEEMELDIAKLEFDFMGTSVICRSGSPLIMADLKKVSVSKARSVIVLAEIDNADQSDARALRVVLSLTGIKEGLRGHIVVEMRDLDNEAIVKLVGGEMVETVVAHDVIGRLMIQCARQPGLAQIWEDILGFEKAEFYIKRWPELDGICFRDVLISFPDAVPCGVKVHAEGGRIFINPDDDYMLCKGDEILVIAEDDDTYSPAPLPQVQTRLLPRVLLPPNVPEKILFCGWRRDIQDMIKVLDAFLAPGSELWIFSDVPECDREKKLLYGNLNPDSLENIKLVHREGNTVIRRHLESLPLEDFDSILILADEKLEDTVVNADSSSLATLLLIRDIQSKRLPLEVSKGSQNRATVQSQSSWIREMHEASNKTIIISEILDSRTKNLVSVSKISDYVLSNELVSMALAMVAEDKQINRVLEELFAEEGNELYIRPAEFYLYDQEELSYFEIMIRARQREEIVIGYRKAAADQAVINPPDKDKVQIWSLQDVFVVLAFEE